MRKIFTIAIFALTINAFAQIPTNGLVGYWPFNGNANDGTSNGNNGTITGATLTTDRFGNANSAYYFPGNVANKIVIPNSNIFNFTNGFSVSVWAFFQQSWSYHVEDIIYKGTVPFNNGWGIGINQDDGGYGVGNYNIGGIVSNGQGSAIGSNYCCFNYNFINQWRHIVLTYDGASLKIYVDGICHDTVQVNNAPINNSNNIEIGGAMNPVSGSYNRSIDDIRIYNRTLSQSEITALYNENLCYQTITVTDTLIINANLTGYNPLTFASKIKIFPNPTNDHITIDYGNYSTLTGYTLKITNSLGQMVFTSPINQQQSYVDLNGWSGNGIYFVHLIDAQSNTIDIRKIVLQ